MTKIEEDGGSPRGTVIHLKDSPNSYTVQQYKDVALQYFCMHLGQIACKQPSHTLQSFRTADFQT